MVEALAVIDAWLDLTNHREQFSSSEVVDRLLDLRGTMVRESVPA